MASILIVIFEEMILKRPLSLSEIGIRQNWIVGPINGITNSGE